MVAGENASASATGTSLTSACASPQPSSRTASILYDHLALACVAAAPGSCPVPTQEHQRDDGDRGEELAGDREPHRAPAVSERGLLWLSWW